MLTGTVPFKALRVGPDTTPQEVAEVFGHGTYWHPGVLASWAGMRTVLVQLPGSLEIEAWSADRFDQVVRLDGGATTSL